MDPYSTWDDLVPNQRARPQPTDDDFSQYFTEYKNFDNLFNEALTTLQDLDVPSGYPVPTAPSQAHSGPFRHSKKPSGTAIFGFVDHTVELSLNGHSSDVYKMMKPPQESVRSISPSQLARQLAYPISNDQLDFNFSQPLEECKPIHLDENDELEHVPVKKNEDIIVTNNNPKSYRFPADAPSPSLRSPSRQNFEEFLTTPIPTIRHPKQTHHYPEDIDALLADTKAKRYVPIPVQEPVLESPLDPTLKKSYHQGISPHMMMNLSPVRLLPQAPMQQSMNLVELLSMNMNVYLPPPSTALSLDLPEPHSPLPQGYWSPVQPQHQRGPNGAGISSPYVKRNFYVPQFFSDDAELYYPEQSGNYQSPMHDAAPPSLNSSPLKGLNESFNDDSVTDANDTILQLTPLKNQTPMTPLKKITLEWSPIISPNAKANNDVRRAIQELSPRRVVKKTSLLPPGELDRYWDGPDENKVFTCTYQDCGKKFTRRYNVRSHIQTHLSDRPFTCTYCPKSFVRQHDLNRHVKSHMVSKHCKCKCGKEFTRVEGYRKHLSNGICSRNTDEKGVLKPSYHRHKGETILDGLTSNRLNDELGL